MLNAKVTEIKSKIQNISKFVKNTNLNEQNSDDCKKLAAKNDTTTALDFAKSKQKTDK